MVDVLSEIQSIFRDVLDNPVLCITRESNGSNVKGWDSLAHINLLLAIQQQFGVGLSLSELQNLQNVGDIVDLINQKLATRADRDAMP